MQEVPFGIRLLLLDVKFASFIRVAAPRGCLVALAPSFLLLKWLAISIMIIFTFSAHSIS